jgi:hypothetical protein
LATTSSLGAGAPRGRSSVSRDLFDDRRVEALGELRDRIYRRIGRIRRVDQLRRVERLVGPVGVVDVVDVGRRFADG